jgi:hypothetical protein
MTTCIYLAVNTTNKKGNNIKYYVIANTRIVNVLLKQNGIQIRRKHLHTEFDFKTSR